jgi:hypothetical protein
VVCEIVIGRIDRATAGIADARANDGWMTPEPGVGTPESTEAERRGLRDGRFAVEWQLHAVHTASVQRSYTHD